MARQVSSLIVAMVMVVIFCVMCADSKPAFSDANQNPAMCKLPAVKGHCRALLARWWFNPATGKCQEFDFGGCDGNANNFMTYKACMAACGGIS